MLSDSNSSHPLSWFHILRVKNVTSDQHWQAILIDKAFLKEVIPDMKFPEMQFKTEIDFFQSWLQKRMNMPHNVILGIKLIRAIHTGQIFYQLYNPCLLYLMNTLCVLILFNLSIHINAFDVIYIVVCSPANSSWIRAIYFNWKVFVSGLFLLK